MFHRHAALVVAPFLSVSGLFLLTADFVKADENPFSYSEGAETQAAGRWEISQWITHRAGKADGTYRATDFFTEFEYGITNSLQASLYLTAAHHQISDVAGLDNVHRTGFAGARLALEYAFSNPDTAGHGLALYVEPEYSRIDSVSGTRVREYGLETKLIFQKDFLNDKVTYLANLTVEPEISRDQGRTQRELELEFAHGLSRRIYRQWYVGLENRWRAGFDAWQVTHCAEYAVFLGPTLHYEGKRWWFTVTWLRQITGWPGTARGLSLAEYERNEFRLKSGIEF